MHTSPCTYSTQRREQGILHKMIFIRKSTELRLRAQPIGTRGSANVLYPTTTSIWLKHTQTIIVSRRATHSKLYAILKDSCAHL